MAYHSARHTPLDGARTFVVSLRMARRSPRPRPRRTVSKSTAWEWVRRWRQASREDQASLACLIERSSRPHHSPGRVPAAEGNRNCELRERSAGARGASPMSLRSTGRTRPFTGCCGVLAAHAPGRPSARRSCAMSGRVPATCCRWTQRGSPSPQSLGTPSPAIAPGARGALDGSSATRSSMPAGLQRAARRRTRRHGDRVHPPCAGLFLERGVVAERLMTDNAFADTKNRALRALLDRRAIRHLRTRPYKPRTNGRSSATNRRCSVSGHTPWSTPQARHVGHRCHTGWTTTTSGAPTAPSATEPPSHSFGEVTGLNS